jgi:Endosomal/lysosomal potassium channel TMEM175
LSDGVFAIIITILVLELAVPRNLSHDSLDQALEELRATLGEYPDEAIALQLYGVVMIAASVMRLAMCWYVICRPNLVWEPSRRPRRAWCSSSPCPCSIFSP